MTASGLGLPPGNADARPGLLSVVPAPHPKEHPEGCPEERPQEPGQLWASETGRPSPASRRFSTKSPSVVKPGSGDPRQGTEQRVLQDRWSAWPPPSQLGRQAP